MKVRADDRTLAAERAATGTVDSVSHRRNPSMHRLAGLAGLAAAALGLMILAGVPAAAAQPASNATELDGGAVAAADQVAVSMPVSGLAARDVDDPAGHESDPEVGAPAEWPEWATTGGSHDGHSGMDMDMGGEEGASDHEGHGSGGDSSGGQEGQEGQEGHGGHQEESSPAPQRPRALVLGSFAAVNGGVLVTAAFLRRRSKGEVQRRKSARAAALRDTDRQPPSPVRAAARSTTPTQPTQP